MIIDCISDLHGSYPKLEGGDLLIVAGDLTARDKPLEHLEFIEWLCKQEYKKKVLILGNHDGVPSRNLPVEDPRGFSYLLDSGTEYKGLKIWGSPWTPTFYNWHFMKDRGDPIKEKWDLIPQDIDILITHGPPFGVQDQVKRFEYPNTKTRIGDFLSSQYECVGCEVLRDAILRIKPRLHVFGHIHESYGVCRFNDILCVNACIMDQNYKPVNKPIRIEYDGIRFTQRKL